MSNQEKNVRSTFSPGKVFVAILIGLVVNAYLIYRELEDTGKSIGDLWEDISHPFWGWLLLSVVVLVIRDAGYTYRIRNLTHKELSWKSSLYTILLWEFASAVTPSVVGGTAVAVFILSKEGIRFGKALAYVMLTAILDNVFFLVAAPLALFLAPGEVFPKISSFSLDFRYLFFISYGLIAFYTLLMAYGLLINPRAFKWLLVKMTRWTILRRWNHKALMHGNEMLLASRSLKGIGVTYWLKAIGSTFLVWTARYLMLNCLLAAYWPGMHLDDHLTAFSKQILLWVTQLISPTPGASGFAEAVLKYFFAGTFVAGIISSLALLWRGMTYYAYLLIGSFVFPKWLAKVNKVKPIQPKS